MWAPEDDCTCTVLLQRHFEASRSTAILSGNAVDIAIPAIATFVAGPIYLDSRFVERITHFYLPSLQSRYYRFPIGCPKVFSTCAHFFIASTARRPANFPVIQILRISHQMFQTFFILSSKKFLDGSDYGWIGSFDLARSCKPAISFRMLVSLPSGSSCFRQVIAWLNCLAVLKALMSSRKATQTTPCHRSVRARYRFFHSFIHGLRTTLLSQARFIEPWNSCRS